MINQVPLPYCNLTLFDIVLIVILVTLTQWWIVGAQIDHVIERISQLEKLVSNVDNVDKIRKETKTW